MQIDNTLQNKVFTNADQEVVPYDGSPITWRVSAYALIFQDDKILLIKNKLEKLYDIVGGGIEIGETIEEGLNRECMEEAGATIVVGELLHAQNGWFYHRNGTFYHTIQLYYRAQLKGALQSPTDPDIEKVFFATIGDLENFPLPPTVNTVLAQAQKK